MLRFPNPGSNIARFVAVYQTAFRALSGKIITLDDIVKIVVEAGFATSSGYAGEEAIRRSTRKDRSRDPLYNQMKMYAELFRIMGWLHPTTEKALNFRFTLLGKQIVEAESEYWPLFKQCTLGIAYPTHVLSVNGVGELRPFASILEVANAMDGYISRDEMIIGPLSAKSDKDNDMVMICDRIAKARKSKKLMGNALDTVD